MKIVVLDGHCENPGDLSWAPIEAFGELTVYERSPLHDEAEVIRRIGGAEIVFTNKTPVTASVLDACPQIRFIAVLSTGYDVVDIAAARERGIPVSNVPGYGTASVAQFAIALLLELCGHVGAHNESVHAGKWASCPDYCYWESPLTELAGKTMGVIGFGRIGQQVGRIAAALGMTVIAYNRSRSESGAAVGEYVELSELLRRSDVISLHCPLNDSNRGLINRETIAQMKDGVLLINNARGGLLVEQDVADALESGKIAGAAVDVASAEPIHADNPLLNARNCIITPHISWAPVESRRRIMDMSAENLRAFLAGKPVHVVNP